MCILSPLNSPKGNLKAGFVYSFIDKSIILKLLKSPFGGFLGAVYRNFGLIVNIT